MGREKENLTLYVSSFSTRELREAVVTAVLCAEW